VSPSPKALSRSFKVVEPAIWAFFFTFYYYFCLFIYFHANSVFQISVFRAVKSLSLRIQNLFFWRGGVGGIKKRGDLLPACHSEHATSKPFEL